MTQAFDNQEELLRRALEKEIFFNLKSWMWWLPCDPNIQEAGVGGSLQVQGQSPGMD